MTNKLSDRIKEEISFWPKTASMVTTLREAMDVVKAWEDAPSCVVTAADCGGFDDPDKAALEDLVAKGKRVKLVGMGDVSG